jgi:hypothetical protein
VSLKTPSRPDFASVPWLPRAVTEKCNFTEPEVRLCGFLQTSHSERNSLENREDGVSSILFAEVRRQNRPLRSSYRLMEVPVLGLLGISKQFQNGRSRKFVASWGRAPHTTLYVVDRQISSSDRAYVRALAGNSSSHNQFCSERVEVYKCAPTRWVHNNGAVEPHKKKGGRRRCPKERLSPSTRVRR